MPQYTNADREMLFAEESMWNVIGILGNVCAGSFQSRIDSLSQLALALARELRDYNDQFEETEE